MAHCECCNVLLKDTDKCTSCSLCQEAYHDECVNMRTTRSARETWVCPKCVMTQKRRAGCNANTPVKTIQGQKGSVTLNTVVKNPIARTGTDTNSPTAPVVVDASLPSLSPRGSEVTSVEVNDFSITVRAAKAEIKEFRSSLNKCLNSFKEFHSRLDTLEQRLLVLQERDQLVEGLQERVQLLENELHAREQRDALNELEITGIKEKPSENLVHVIAVIATKLGVDLDEKDVDYVSRVGPRRGTGEARSRPVVARLCRPAVRDKILKAAKVRRGLNTEDMQLTGTKNSIFVNERLSKINRQLFYTARGLAKTNNFRYTWIRQGFVYVRRETGAPAFRIANEKDLAKITRQTSTGSEAEVTAAGARAGPGGTAASINTTV